MRKLKLGKSIEHLKAPVSDTCEGCLWEGNCSGCLPCFDYDTGDKDNYISEYIEARRVEFGQDFNEYVNEEN